MWRQEDTVASNQMKTLSLSDEARLKHLSEPFAFVYERMGIYGDICISGTKGADFYGDVCPLKSAREMVVTKHHLSAFGGIDLNSDSVATASRRWSPSASA